MVQDLLLQIRLEQKKEVSSFYTLNNSDDEILREDTVSGTGVEFTGLIPFTSYTLSVSAEKQFASGPVASNTTRTKKGSKYLAYTNISLFFNKFTSNKRLQFKVVKLLEVTST